MFHIQPRFIVSRRSLWLMRKRHVIRMSQRSFVFLRYCILTSCETLNIGDYEGLAGDFSTFCLSLFYIKLRSRKIYLEFGIPLAIVGRDDVVE